MSKIEVCKLCNKEYSRIATHLTRTHKVKAIDYYREHDREKYLSELQVEFLNEFYISYRRKFLKMKNNRQITTVEAMLNDGAIKQHISQRHRIGIKFSSSGSDVIGLDIDILDAEVLDRTYQTLLGYGIPSNNMLTTFSGNKGYHIDIFLNEYMSRELIQAFYDIILNDIGYSTIQIELMGANDSGYFLPFGINYKGVSNKHYGFCGIVNHLGIMDQSIESEINKLETMEKIDSSIIKDIVLINYRSIDADKTKTTDKVEVDDIDELNNTLQSLELLEIHNTDVNGVVAQIGTRTVIEEGTRHKLAFIYAQALRDYGMSESELYNQLILWHDNLESGYKSSAIEIENDCKAITRSVFMKQGNRYRYNLPSNSKAHITKSNIKEFVTVKSKADRRVYLALAIHSNSFKDHKGQFYMTYKQIKEMIDINTSNDSLLSYIERLEKNGYVEIISQNKRVKGQSKHESNVYKILADEDAKALEEDIYYLSSSSKINKLEIADAIKEILTVREYKSLIKSKGNLDNLLSCLVA